MKVRKGIIIKEIIGARVAVLQGASGVDMTKVLSFNPVSEWLWNELQDKEFEEADVAGLLVNQYNIDEAVAMTDARKWIAQCKEFDLIQ